MSKGVKYRRIYEDASTQDGKRILVDRIWPRGIRKTDANLDEWLRDIAPSTELRQWYGHDPDKFSEFRQRYLVELREPIRDQSAKRLREMALRNRLTLLTASKDLEHSEAAVLAAWLNNGSR